MIQKLIIENFQSHKDTELDFVDGINVITGSGNSGKTAMFRAINWVVFNRPMGFGFVRWNTSSCTVGLSVVEANSKFNIIRHRDKKENNYEITGSSVNGKNTDKSLMLEALKGDVPEQVVGALNLSELNIQDQLSPYFLVLDSPGKVALCLREVTGLDEIDELVTYFSRQITAEELLLTKNSERMTELIEAQARLRDFNAKLFEECLEQAEALEAEIRAIKTKLVSLSSAIMAIEETQTEQIMLPANLDRQIEKWDVLRDEFSGTVDTLEELESAMASIETSMAQLAQIPEVKEELLDEKLINSYVVVKGTCLDLELAIQSIGLSQAEYGKVDKAYNTLAGECIELSKKLVNCPLCGLELTDLAKTSLLAE